MLMEREARRVSANNDARMGPLLEGGTRDKFAGGIKRGEESSDKSRARGRITANLGQ